MTAVLHGRPELAIDGATPIRETFLPFGAPCLGEEEIGEVVDTLRSGWIGTGPKALRFEQEFAAYVGAPHALALNSCTAGLFLGLLALGLQPGDEVITTTLTFAATVNVIEHIGARPVLVDIDPQSLTIDPELVARAVTPRTRAIIPVHFGGLACDMQALDAIAARHNLAIIEDAAHAVGTRHNGRMAGTLGNLAAFSFYANKNLTTAEGGMLTTADPLLAERIAMLRMHGLSRDAWRRYTAHRLIKYEVIAPGYKCNLPDLAAAIGLHQLRKQEQFWQTRQRYAQLYDDAFAALPLRFQRRPRDLDQNRHSLHLYVLLLEPGRWRVDRDQIVEALIAENIGATLHYTPIHQHSYYRETYGLRPEQFPQATAVGAQILSLPLTPAMSLADVEDVIQALLKVARAYAC
jgi:dTDP-4-amino-4,6-dideoxygalactose transaminase